MAAEAEGQFSIGQRIAGTPYRVRGLIGSGGMGSVYEVEHEELGKLFVLKALRPQLVERRDLAARMKNEWRALGRLEHPNIVLVTDAGRTSSGVPFYVMERLAGETLAVRLRRDGPLSLAQSLRVAAAILDALAAAHAIGVVHRDIKPQNVFLPSGGGIKLLDFGVAKLRDQAAMVVTRRGVAIGTPKYMSPEQAEGNAVDGRADVYAVGLVLFELIAGRGPFAHHREANDLVLAHITEVPPRLDAVRPDVPAEFADLLQRWLSKDPADRPLDAGVAAGELRRMLGRFGSEVAPSGDDPTRDVDYDAPTRGPECHVSPVGEGLWSSATRTALDHAGPQRLPRERAAPSGRAVPDAWRRQGSVSGATGGPMGFAEESSAGWGSPRGDRRSETPPPAAQEGPSGPVSLSWARWVGLAGAAGLATFGFLLWTGGWERPASVFVAPALASEAESSPREARPTSGRDDVSPVEPPHETAPSTRAPETASVGSSAQTPTRDPWGDPSRDPAQGGGLARGVPALRPHRGSPVDLQVPTARRPPAELGSRETATAETSSAVRASAVQARPGPSQVPRLFDARRIDDGATGARVREPRVPDSRGPDQERAALRENGVPRFAPPESGAILPGSGL